MRETIKPAVLTIHEKIRSNARRKRRIRVTAESVTIGTESSADIELKAFSESFMAEIKFANNTWWIVNPMRSNQMRVNGRLVILDHPLSHDDQLIIHEHQLVFELEEPEEADLEKQQYDFLPHPGSNESLWNYLIREEEFDEILINGADTIFVDYKGSLIRSPYSFDSNDFLSKRIKHYSKKEDGWSSWQLNRSLRFQAALPPVTDQPHISIRKARQHVFTLEELQDLRFGTEEQIEFLQEALENRESILISGGTSTGKTVLCRSLVERIPANQRVVVIEEESETDWPHPHAVAIEAGRGKVRQSVIESLRFRPDRLIISEVRGEEAFEFLQAINTGHEGSMTTIHSNSAREALSRIENLVLSTGLAVNSLAIRAQMAQAIDIVVQLKRDTDGTRKISEIRRLTGMEKDVILMSDPIGTEARGIRQDLSLVSD